jgi:hypothetical protein
MPNGQSTTTFTISALASHTYEVTVAAPATATIVVTMNADGGTRSTLDTLHGQGCHTNSGRAVCRLHFAEGGTPGGTWRVVIQKSSRAPASVRVSVLFNRS